MRVAVTGASGLIGSALVPFLRSGGHEVLRLVRREAGEGEARWDPATGYVDAAALDGMDAVVHLAGENIAAGRWTVRRKRRIRESRVRGTRVLADALAGMPVPPAALLSASATGYYGDRGDEELDESSGPGEGFLAGLCRDWEGAAAPASRVGMRVVTLRLGVLLTPAGGALAKMLPPFRLGLGGRIGPGTQYVAWIGMDDLLAALLHVLANPSLEGPVNLVAPRPVTNAELARALGRVLRRPAAIPLPAPVARLLLGEMADEALLASARVVPARLLESGLAFRDAEIEGALRRLLGRPAGGRSASAGEVGGRAR
jgi:uncharacterized protein (TIGR01777 family)